VRAKKIMETRKRDVDGPDNRSLYEEYEEHKEHKEKKVRQSEERSDELTTLAMGTKDVRPCTPVQDAAPP